VGALGGPVVVDGEGPIATLSLLRV